MNIFMKRILSILPSGCGFVGYQGNKNEKDKL